MTKQIKPKDGNQVIQEEMIGVLTAISIVSKRLANRLSQLDAPNEKKGEEAND